MDFKIELIPVPVTDVDRARAFYERAGFHVDIDSRFPGGRFVQITPPGSACSIALENLSHDSPEVPLSDAITGIETARLARLMCSAYSSGPSA